MNLNTTTRKLQAFISGAPATTNPTVTVSFHDVLEQIKEDFSQYKKGIQFTVLAGTTETDVCDAPGQGIDRQIDYINVYNTDSASVTFTLAIDDAGTNRIQVVITLATTESAVWTPESSWNITT